MIICSELVKYARQRKRLPIQLSDVNALVQKMICNESSISRKDFDNLISCGGSRLDIIDKDDSLKVLKDIAVKSRNIDYYDINEIKVFGPDKVKNIIDDLLRRGVLQRHTDFSNKVKIKVAPKGFTSNVLDKVSLNHVLGNEYKNAKFNNGKRAL